MKILFEFVVLGSAGTATIVYVTHVINKLKERGYVARFVGGPLDGKTKKVRTLSPEYKNYSPKDYRGNQVVTTYKIDELGLGVYTIDGREEVI